MEMEYYHEIPRNIVMLKPENPGVLMVPTVRVKGFIGPALGPTIRGLLSWDTDYNLITEECRQKFGLPLIRGEPLFERELKGTGTGILGRTRIKFCPHFNEQESIQLNVVVVENITQQVPSARAYTMLRPHLAGLNLADPSFEEPGSVDLLTGLLVSRLLLENDIKMIPGTGCYTSDMSLMDGSVFVPPMMKVGDVEMVGTGCHVQETALGWTVSGRLPPVEQVKIIPLSFTEQVSTRSEASNEKFQL